MKILLSLFLLMLFFGCIQSSEDSESIESEVNENIRYNYSIQKEDNNLVSCAFTISSFGETYFHVYSTDNSTISGIIYDLEKLRMERDESTGLIKLSGGEAAFDDSSEYFIIVPLSRGDYGFDITSLYADGITVVIESSEELDCW
jgi:hypothetical protein